MKFLLLAILIACSQAEVEEVEPFLTGGVVAVSGEFPSAVFIRAPGTLNSLCGGTVVDRQHILTSAQCVLNNQNQLINPFWFTVTAGDLNVVTPTNLRLERKVSRIFVHPNFNPTTRNNDLAVLRVSQPYPDFHNSIESVLRSEQMLATGTACQFVAWGAASNAANAPIQPALRVMNAPVLDTLACNQANVHANRVLNVHICAGSIPSTNPVSGACTGNIGSGLYCNNQLSGILSFGTSCGVANQPGVYTDVRQYQNWINSQLIRTDNPQPGWTPTPTM